MWGGELALGISSKLENRLEGAKEIIYIRLNGEEQGIDQGLTVSVLLQELDILSDRVAVEINMEILEKQDFECRALKEGDHVEIISFIGGGSDGVIF